MKREKEKMDNNLNNEIDIYNYTAIEVCEFSGIVFPTEEQILRLENLLKELCKSIQNKKLSNLKN